MRFMALFRKTAIENVRDWKILVMTVLFAPLFVILMYFYFTSASQTYAIILINHDAGVATDDSLFYASQAFVDEMENASYSDGTKIFALREETDIVKAKNSLIDKSADLLVVIPENFTSSLAAYGGAGQPPATMSTLGDLSNQKYVMAAAYSDLLSYTFAAAYTGAEEPLVVDVQTMSGADMAKPVGMFDQIVPGLLVLALMMLMFTAAASIIREKDKGTIIRLQMSKMSLLDFLASLSLVQIIIGIVAMALAFATALAIGYQSRGSLLAMLVICILCTLSIIAISLIVSVFLRSIFDLMTIGCFPFFILMFFSGGMFPLPSLQIFSIAGHPVNVNDILPTSPAISAMGKVLNHGAGLDGIAFELALLALLTVAYFAIGVLLFRRKYLRTG